MQSLQGCWRFLLLLLFPVLASANSEGDALHAQRQALVDPSNVLQSWDPSLPNPCSWFHVTCNNENSVVRVDLGNAGLSGVLVSTLGSLPALQYLELFSNNITGIIPIELGRLTNLVSLDLYQNDFSGPIPLTLGRLSSLRFFRLNSNSLVGHIPVQLTSLQHLQVLDLSNNQLTGKIPTNGSFSTFTATSFSNNPGLCGKLVHKRCHPLKAPPPYAYSPADNPAKSQRPPITRGDDG